MIASAIKDGATARGDHHMKRFEALEGFRAVLAWWVVLGHMLMYARISGNDMWPVLDLGRQGIIAVYVFMIISGFVITHLLTQRREPYGIYIMRRFLRLWPVFAVVVTFVAVANLFGVSLRNPGDDLGLHYLAEITMLHGLIPNEILNDASQALAGPGWSISLEWQFYIIAPLLLVVFTTRHWVRWPVAAAVLAFATTGALGTELDFIDLFGQRWSYDKPSALFFSLPFFCLGMLCYWIFSNFGGAVKTTLPAALVIAAIALGFARSHHESLALFIWAFLFSLLLIQQGPVYKFFKQGWLKWIGDISYSTYITHIVVLELLVDYAIPRSHDKWTYFATIVAAGIPTILAVSAASYYGLEKPAINLGRRLAKRMQAKPETE
jgi:peptidoglycan/LPS O-acetylase OafA/YrhL